LRDSPRGASAGFHSLRDVVQWTYSLDSIRKQLRRISQRKGDKRKWPEGLHVDFSDDFAVAIRWLRGGHGWNAGSRSITAIHILKENWYPTRSLDGDYEGGKANV
jgi:hypothetical protein